MKTLRFAIPWLLAALALVGCSGDTHETFKTVPLDRCAESQNDCDDPTGRVTCDPLDGVCKCGGRGGLVCEPGTICHLDQNTPTCISENCNNVACAPFEACDAIDGTCKCNGVVCDEGSTCLADGCSETNPCAGVVCGDNQVCDPADRICKCGTGICSMGETCRLDSRGVGFCVGANCVGKNCAEGTVCNPADGLCHCGSADGDVCTTGQTCKLDGGAAVCDGLNICESKVCTGSTTCSPLDGKCRCGGYDATAPICAEDQTCDPTQNPPRCAGGDICADVTCPEFTNLTCDGESGECTCGGYQGVACRDGEGCIDADGVPTCVTRCDPNAPNVVVTVCGSGGSGGRRGCYLSPSDGFAYCASAGNVDENGTCRKTTDCRDDHHCVLDGDYGHCRRYCDVNVTNDCNSSSRSCVGIGGPKTNLPNLGVCLVVST